MHQKKLARLRRAKRTRLKLRELNVYRLTVNRTNQHIYAQILSPCGSKVITCASTLDSEISKEKNVKNIGIASQVGQLVAKKAIALGVNKVGFDRSGFKYHGRVKALAEAAREAGLQF